MSERDHLEDEDAIRPEDLEEEELLEEDLPEEDLDEDPPEEEPEPRPTRQLGRKEREVIKARRRAQAAETERDEIARRLARLEGQTEVLSRQPQPQQSAEDKRAEAERLAAMTPEERVEYRIEQERRQIQQAFTQTNFQAADRADKVEFRLLCQESPAFQSVRQEVEDELAKMRRNGFNANREDVAYRILGQRAAKKKAMSEDRGRSRTRTRAPGARSDVGGETRERTRAPATARERLEALEAKGLNPFAQRRR